MAMITGTAQSETLTGTAGDDILLGLLGADLLIGAGGIDTASYEDNQGAVFVNLLDGLGYGNSAAGDQFSGIENLLGSAFNDYFIGDDGINRLDGDQGNDTLIGGLGADVLVGGAGIDTASYEDNQGAVFVNLFDGLGYGNAAAGDQFSGIENLLGSAFNDYFIGDDGINRLDGDHGNDALIGGLGADVLIGGAGIDTASYEDNQGSVFVNLSIGQGFNNAAEGDTYQGIENVTGGAFSDFIIGDDNANRLAGGGGADTLRGLGGADTLIGGEGADTYMFNTALGADNIDTILDFEVGVDKIELDDGIFTGLNLAGTALSPSAFHTGSAAHDADDRIIYDASTGALYFDVDGSGALAAVQFASLSIGLGLSAGDFIVTNDSAGAWDY